jgi:2-iminobutanoate/2-iminopropanoate deaminase
MKNITHPKRAKDFETGAYSDGIIVDKVLYISGQASVDFETSDFKLGTIEEETRRTLQNVKAILESSGSTMADVIKCNVHLANIDDFELFNEVYSTYFPDVKPVRTTVQSGLAGEIKVEIDCIAKVST